MRCAETQLTERASASSSLASRQMSQSRSGPRRPGLLDRLFLAVCCPAVLPGFLGPVPLLHAARRAVAGLLSVAAAVLVLTAPLLIPLLVWNALGQSLPLPDLALGVSDDHHPTA